jgi:hypothetical protein
MALTATANGKVVQDIIQRLGMRDCVKLIQSFNRPNLYYEVREKKGKKLLEDIKTYIQSRHAGECGIIYCLSRNKCEEVATELRESYALKAKHYHAQMSTGDKVRTQQDWQSGVIHIIVATVRPSFSSVYIPSLIPSRCRLHLEWASTRELCASSSTTRSRCLLAIIIKRLVGRDAMENHRTAYYVSL